MATEVDLLARKIDPILRRVEQAQSTIHQAKGLNPRLSQAPGALGMLSKMGGRLIAFYADDLATMLFEDFLTETITDLQTIEDKNRAEMTSEETKEVVENILGVIKDYQNDETHIDTKWGNITVQQ